MSQNVGKPTLYNKATIEYEESIKIFKGLQTGFFRLLRS
jgi:hypothetical protein